MSNRPHSNGAAGNDGLCADPFHKRTHARQKPPVHIWATSTAPEKRSVCFQIRPHIRSVDQRPELPKVEIPIDHSPRPAGSGIRDFRTPAGVRNSSGKRTFRLKLIPPVREPQSSFNKGEQDHRCRDRNGDDHPFDANWADSPKGQQRRNKEGEWQQQELGRLHP